MNIFYFSFFTRLGEKIADGTTSNAQDFLAAASRVLETHKAEDIYVQVWDVPREGDETH